MTWCCHGPFCVFDVETTGMSPARDRIVELAALRVECDGSRRRFHSLVNPGRPIPRGVIRIHHIDDAMVADAPDFAAVAAEFLPFIEGATLVAHNARFDLGFLQESLNRCGLPLWRGRTLDTVRLMRTVYPGLPSYRLQVLRELFRLDAPDSEFQDAHRAAADVDWTMQLLKLALTAAETHATGSPR